MANWSQPICDRCYIERPASYMNAPGISEEPVLREPARMNGVEHGSLCAYCGNPTWAGIFVREDPAKVPFPAPDTD